MKIFFYMLAPCSCASVFVAVCGCVWLCVAVCGCVCVCVCVCVCFLQVCAMMYSCDDGTPGARGGECPKPVCTAINYCDKRCHGNPSNNDFTNVVP